MSRLLGIDASKSVVRVALLRTSYRHVVVEGLGEIDVATAGSEVDAIRAAVGMHKPDAAAIALSGEKSFYRRLELPAAAQREIGNVLAFELESTVPFEMDDSVFDHRLLKRPVGAKNTDPIPLFAVVARTADVRERIQVVREAIGIEPERVGTGPLPLANLSVVTPELDRPTVAEPLGILNLSELVSEILIVQRGEPVYARTLSRGTLGLPQSAPALARELRQTFASWRTLGGDPVAGLYLVGPGASASGAEYFLAGELGIPLLPLPQLKIEGLTPEQIPQLPRFAQALGLALGLMRSKSLNLRRGALEAERSYPFLREKIPLLAGLGAVIAVSFGFSIVAELKALDVEHELLLAKLSMASRDILGEQTNDPKTAKTLLDGPTGIDEDPMPHADGFDAMIQISKAVPREVVHDVLSFEFSRQHLNVEGTVPTVGDAETIAKNLKEYKCARDVKITRTTQFGDGKHKYTLESDLKCVDPAKKKKPGAPGAEPDGSGSPVAGPKPDGKDGGR